MEAVLKLVKILGWAGYGRALGKVSGAFRDDTGRTVGFRGERNQDDMFRAAAGSGSGIACPATDRLAGSPIPGLLPHGWRHPILNL